MKDMIFKPCLRKSDKPIFQYLEVVDGQEPEWLEVKSVVSHGGRLMHNFGECPNTARGSSLSRVLEIGGDCRSII